MTEATPPTNEVLTLEFNFDCNIRDVDQFALPKSYLFPEVLPETKHEPIHCDDILVEAPQEQQQQPETRISLPKGWRKLNIADLRSLCRELSLSSEGSKAEIMQRLAASQ